MTRRMFWSISSRLLVLGAPRRETIFIMDIAACPARKRGRDAPRRKHARPYGWRQAEGGLLVLALRMERLAHVMQALENRLIGQTGKPDFDNPKVGVNSRLFDGFGLDAVPVTVIDGKNRW